MIKNLILVPSLLLRGDNRSKRAEALNLIDWFTEGQKSSSFPAKLSCDHECS